MMQFYFFPLMIEAFQLSERGSLVETNKNGSGKLAKSLGSLKSAGGERRWEPRGEASTALRFSWKQKTQPSTSLCASKAFPPLHPRACHGVPSAAREPLGDSGCCEVPAASQHPTRQRWALATGTIPGLAGLCLGAPGDAQNRQAAGITPRWRCRGPGYCCCVSWPPSPGADTLIPAFRREMCGPGHRRPAASPLMPLHIRHSHAKEGISF